MITLNSMEVFATIVKQIMEEHYPEHKITLTNVTKNNNVRLTGLSMVSKDTNLPTVIHLETFYQHHKQGIPLTVICDQLKRVYEKNCIRGLGITSEQITDFEFVKTSIFYHLINREQNKKLLATVPFLPFQDLAIVFDIIASDDTVNPTTILIENELMETWGVADANKLYEIAHPNTQKKYKAQVNPLTDIARELAVKIQNDIALQSVDAFVQSDALNPNAMKLYVATNDKYMHGANVITYDGFLKEFAEMMNSDFYILPSSIHDVILVPVDEIITVEDLTKMVQEVNETEVDADEILSYSVYRYYAHENCIKIM